MPLVRITMPKGKTQEYRKAVSQGVHAALVETFNVPQDDLFQIITEAAPQAEIVHAPSYLGIKYTDDLVLIQLTVSDTRTVEQKKQLFARIVDHLAESPGLRREDVFINLVEVKKENWSFGNGLAQYA
ncbi:MAG TPA: tautomerase family protein [Hyphomicrobiaceae bacterium]|nr:tautomerase family protein [Hyphomicrobiaceae bacterium]